MPKYSKTIQLVDDENGSEVQYVVASDDSAYVSNINEAYFSLVTTEKGLAEIDSRDADQGDCDEDEYVDITPIVCYVESSDIKTETGEFSIVIKGNPLKGCRSDYSGAYYRLLSGPPGPSSSRNSYGVDVKNTSGAICNAVKCRAWQDNISWRLGSDTELKRKGDWFHSPTTSGNVKRWIILDLHFKNTKATTSSNWVYVSFRY